jgi:hypothetical protein
VALPFVMQLLRRVVLHGIPDYEATARGGCTPFLQVLPAPWQNYKPDLLYNSAWQRPKFETYMPDANGTIVFEVRLWSDGLRVDRSLRWLLTPFVLRRSTA